MPHNGSLNTASVIGKKYLPLFHQKCHVNQFPLLFKNALSFGTREFPPEKYRVQRIRQLPRLLKSRHLNYTTAGSSIII